MPTEVRNHLALPLSINKSVVDRFTQPEKLGQKEYSCSKCGKAAHVSRVVKEASLVDFWSLFTGRKQEIEHQKATSSTQLPIQGDDGKSK